MDQAMTARAVATTPPVRRWRGAIRRWLVVLSALAALLSAVEGVAGWGARKAPASPTNPSKPSTRKVKPKSPAQRPPPTGAAATTAPATGAAATAQATDPDDAERRALQPPLRLSRLLPLLRQAIAARDMARAVRLAEAVLHARAVAAADVVEVASAFDAGSGLPVQVALWRRAAAGALAPWLRDIVEQGLADALLASDAVEEAEAVLRKAARRRPAGTRGPVLERLVAVARLRGTTEELLPWLMALRDPDGAIHAARVVAEGDGEEAGAAILRSAFARFPGHRGLAGAWMEALVRLGQRGELEQVLARVIALAPSDPMPWLRLLDAHIVVRDVAAARALIDRLAARYPRHDALIEALIDREQRLGDDEARTRALYERLLAAAPREAGYIEAYAEWLLGRSHGRVDAALAALRKLETLPLGRYEGRRRMAALLATHGYIQEARAILLTLDQEFPGRRATRRALAELASNQQRLADAEPLWWELCATPAGANPELRAEAAEARRGLLSLWRRAGVVVARLQALAERHARQGLPLAEALVLLDGVSQDDDPAVAALIPDAALAPDGALRQLHGDDAELLALVGATLLRRRLLEPALEVAQTLVSRQAEGGRDLAQRVAERALATRQPAVAARAEALLWSERAETTTLLTLGDRHLAAGDAEGAAALYRRAASQAPHDVRPLGRLARLLREKGDAAGEVEALRAVVARSADPDELDAATARLLALAMGRGEVAPLLRWLDAITPQHPRRDFVERARLLVYDAWLRTEPLERRLRGGPGDDPGASRLGDALASGDLAVRVRALRQAALQRRPLPPALAAALLRDPSAVVRRETMQALAAIADQAAAVALVQAEPERSLDVLLAHTLALARVPAQPQTLELLQSRAALRNADVSVAAVLAIGALAAPPALADLLRWGESRRELRMAAAIALGPVVRARAERPEVAAALAYLDAVATQEVAHERGSALTMAACGLWGLGAAGTPEAQALLARHAVLADGPLLRRVAVTALALGPTLALEAALFQWEDIPSDGLGIALITRALRPLFDLDPERLRASLAASDAAVAKALAAATDEWRSPFCADLGPYAAGGSAVAAACAATTTTPTAAGSPAAASLVAAARR